MILPISDKVFYSRTALRVVALVVDGDNDSVSTRQCSVLRWGDLWVCRPVCNHAKLSGGYLGSFIIFLINLMVRLYTENVGHAVVECVTCLTSIQRS